MDVPADWAAATVRFSITEEIRDEDAGEIARRVGVIVRRQRELRGWTPGHSARKITQEATA
jgi:ribosome-binding protein aMBF1 (putative translation factor)